MEIVAGGLHLGRGSDLLPLNAKCLRIFSITSSSWLEVEDLHPRLGLRAGPYVIDSLEI